MLSNVKVIQCDICKQAVTTPVPKDTIVSALVMCMSCFARVPEAVSNRFLESAAWPLDVEIKKETENGPG